MGGESSATAFRPSMSDDRGVCQPSYEYRIPSTALVKKDKYLPIIAMENY
jgi:hypothetical protein